MKYNLTGIIKQLNGEPFQESIVTEENGKTVKKLSGIPLTFKKAFLLTLENYYPGDEQQPFTKLYTRYDISKRIISKPAEVEISVEEITELKEIIRKYWGAIVLGRISDLLENKE
jgi:hypothetical protein